MLGERAAFGPVRVRRMYRRFLWREIRCIRLVVSSPAVYSIADCIHFVKRTAYMEFREAVDRLGERVTHEQVAEALGVSVASVRQYRLAREAKAHRNPPNGWERVLAKLARERGEALLAFADELWPSGKS
jgi:hypothetical protein